jgi:hypothetical protein
MIDLTFHDQLRGPWTTDNHGCFLCCSGHSSCCGSPENRPEKFPSVETNKCTATTLKVGNYSSLPPFDDTFIKESLFDVNW